MLSIMCALKKWQVDLLRSHIHICTDHKTLQNFDFQWDLSQHQARWMKYLSECKYSITYINGKQNTVANALSRLPDSVNNHSLLIVALAVFTIQSHPKLITRIKNRYQAGLWCLGLLDDMKWGMLNSKLNILLKHGLLFIGEWLVIPKYKNLREWLFQLAHDNLGHFGMEKSYTHLQNDLYWPNMQKDLAQVYIPGCMDCQHNKSTTMKAHGPLHPLPIPHEQEPSDMEAAQTFIETMEKETNTAKDNLLTAKLQQAHFTNKDHHPEPTFTAGEKVFLATTHWWWDCMHAKDGHITQFMPRYDGPYKVTQAHPKHHHIHCYSCQPWKHTPPSTLPS